MSSSNAIDALLNEIGRQERRARRRAIIYTSIPIVVAVVLVAWTARQVNRANLEVKNAQQRVASLQRQADSAKQQLQDAATNLVSIARVTSETESLIESKQSYLRTLDEARFLIDLRMKFDAINADLIKLSASFPAMQAIADHRRWVTVVKSSKDFGSLRSAGRTLSQNYGASQVAIYRAENGFYALVILGDGTFTQAYRLTASLIRNGKATDAYFAEASGWTQVPAE